MKNYKTSLSIFLLLLLGFIWGSGYSLAKFAMTKNVPALGYAFWQSLGPAILLSFLAVMKGNRPLFKTAYWPYFIVCGLIGIAIPNTNMYLIAAHIPAGLLAVLVNTVPLIVYPIAVIFAQERLDFWRILAVFIAMAGIFLIIMPDETQFLSTWTLLALISPLSFALCSIYISTRQPAISSLDSACGMLVAAALLLTPLVIQQHAFYPLSPPYTNVQGVIVLEIFLSSIGYLLFFKLITLAGPVFYSLTGGIVALTGLFWGSIIFSEKPDKIQGLAIICITSALFLISWRQSRQAQGASNDLE